MTGKGQLWYMHQLHNLRKDLPASQADQPWQSLPTTCLKQIAERMLPEFSPRANIYISNCLRDDENGEALSILQAFQGILDRWPLMGQDYFFDLAKIIMQVPNDSKEQSPPIQLPSIPSLICSNSSTAESADSWFKNIDAPRCQPALSEDAERIVQAQSAASKHMNHRSKQVKHSLKSKKLVEHPASQIESPTPTLIKRQFEDQDDLRRKRRKISPLRVILEMQMQAGNSTEEQRLWKETERKSAKRYISGQACPRRMRKRTAPFNASIIKRSSYPRKCKSKR